MPEITAPAIDREPGRTVFYLDHPTREKVLAKRAPTVKVEPVKKATKKK